MRFVRRVLPSMRMRIGLLVVASFATGVALTLVVVDATRADRVSVRPAADQLHVPSISGGRSHFDQPIYVGESDRGRAAVMPDGPVRLVRAGVPRVLFFATEDIPVALTAIEEFVGALRADYLVDRGDCHATLRHARILWRREGELESQRLRVVVTPTLGSYDQVRLAERYAEALGWWAIANGAYPEPMTRADGAAGSVSAVHAPRSEFAIPVFEVAEALFSDGGENAVRMEVADGRVIAVARDSSDKLTWVFSYCADQGTGSYQITNFGRPFDVEAAEAMLVAILSRALGRKVIVNRAVACPR